MAINKISAPEVSVHVPEQKQNQNMTTPPTSPVANADTVEALVEGNVGQVNQREVSPTAAVVQSPAADDTAEVEVSIDTALIAGEESKGGAFNRWNLVQYKKNRGKNQGMETAGNDSNTKGRTNIPHGNSNHQRNNQGGTKSANNH